MERFEKEKVIKAAVQNPVKLFSFHELTYISKRFPFSGEKLAETAFVWAEKIGHRKQMADYVSEDGIPQQRANFAFRFNTYEQEMKEKVESAKAAYFWAKLFPEDSDEFIDLIETGEWAYRWAKLFPEDSDELIDFVKGGEWAYRWAKNVGDKEKMKSRISTTFWEMKFEKDVEENEAVSFASPRD